MLYNLKVAKVTISVVYVLYFLNMLMSVVIYMYNWLSPPLVRSAFHVNFPVSNV